MQRRKDEKILLVNPPVPQRFCNPPLGLLYVAEALERDNINVGIADGAVVGERGILDKVKEYKPDRVGIQILSPYRHAALRVAALVKECSPHIRVVLGGAHATVMSDQLLNYPFIDEVCAGDGEKWLSDTNYFVDLNNIPIPAWHKVEFGRYKINEVSVSTSRGCPNHCSFCFNPKLWRGWRGRSVDNIIDELALLVSIGKKRIFFTDECFSFDRDRTMELCERIVSLNRGIRWFCSTRADSVDFEMLKLMKRAGCWRVAFGVESVSPGIAGEIHKGLGDIDNHIVMVESAIFSAQKAGISVMAAMMVGNPGETDETVRDNADFLKRTMPTMITQARGVWLLPGTALYRKAKKAGYITDDFWYSDIPVMYWPFSQKQLRKWALMLTAYRPFRYFFKRLADRLYVHFPQIHGFFVWITAKFRLPIRAIRTKFEQPCAIV
jgi:radical SAM superfamily enzyme YgiQ (UPF0313 family)